MVGIYRCLYDFTAQLQNDLTIACGDIIRVTKQINSDWLHGVANKKHGQFPCSYVEQVLHSLPDKVGVVLSNFIAEQPGDLPIKKGDVVGIIEHVDENWIQGFSNYGKGIFPAKFIREVDLTLSEDNAATSNSNGTEKSLNNHSNPSEWKHDNHSSANGSVPHGLGVAIDNFHAQDVDELSLNKGDDVELMREIDSFWIEGAVDGQKGKFPREFIQVIVDVPPAMKFVGEVENSENDMVPHAKAIHMFIGENSNEISFDKGDIITLHSRFNKDWMRGKIGNSVGLFPINHVKILVDLPFVSKNSTVSKSNISNSSNGGNVKRNAPAIPPLPQKTCNPVPVTSVENVDNPFPIPPTMYPKQNDSPTSPTPPEVKRRVNKPKQPAKKRSIDPIDFGVEFGVLCAPRNPPPLKEKPALPLKKHATSSNKQPPPPPKKTGKAPPPPPINLAPFELTQERVSLEFAHDAPPPAPLPRCPVETKPPVLPRCPTNQAPQKPKGKPPPRPDSHPTSNVKGTSDNDILSLPPTASQSGSGAKLAKPLVPIPATPLTPPPPPRERIKSSDMTPDVKSKPTHNREPLPNSVTLDSKDMTVSYKREGLNNGTLDRKAATFSKRDFVDNDVHNKQRGSKVISVDERDFRKVTDTKKLSSELVSFEDGSTSNSGFGLSPQDENGTDILRSNELKTIETKIVECKGKIEAAVYQLSGVETLIAFVSDEKVGDLILEKEKQNNDINELNFELNVLEDQKSSLLASYGKVDDVKNRVAELEEQIDKYLDNCDKLRRMQDVSVMEDLPEIRDHIEFCENMIDTLQDELNGLREKLGELDQPDSCPDPEKEFAKKKRNQKKVVDELVYTEECYSHDLTVISEVMKYLEETMSHAVNIKILFGNLHVLMELASRLLRELQSIVNEAGDDLPSRVAAAFLDVCSEMKECYSDYCRNYDDAQSLVEKYEEDPEIMFAINKILQSLNHNSGNLVNLQAYLIKPVQRVLKYPLLFAELLKNNPTEGKTNEDLRFALGQLTDVATAINEFKRRKDLVQKYREIEDGIGKKVQKLNWHSVAKKSSRINQRITQFTGLNSQTRDHTFTDLEKRFRGLEKLIKSFSKNVIQFLEEFQKNSSYVRQCSESIRQFFEDDEVCEEVIKYYSRVYVITEQYASNMVIFINRHVTEPLNQLLQLFQGPFRLIQKRNDKCLDYDRAQNKAMRAKDSKDEEKIKTTQEELQNSANIYLALNTQLLEELPALCSHCSSFLKHCVANFVEAYKRYLSSSYDQMHALWQLPFVSKEGDMLEKHQELISVACEQISQLSFVPFTTPKSDSKKTPTTQTLPTNTNRTSFFVDLDDLGNDPTTPLKPLIEFNGNDIDETDKLSNKNKEKTMNNKLFGTSDWTYQEETNKYIAKYNFQAEDKAELSVAEGTPVTVLRKTDKNGNSEWWYAEVNGQKGYIPQSYLIADNEKDLIYNRSKSSIMSMETPMQTSSSSHSSFLDSDNTDFPAPPPELVPTVTEKHNSMHIGDNSVNKFNTINGNQLPQSYSDQQQHQHLKLPQYQQQQKQQQNQQQQQQQHVQYFFMEYNFEAENPGEISIREGELVKVLAKNDQKGNPEWWLVDYNGAKGYVPGGFLVFLDEVPIS